MTDTLRQDTEAWIATFNAYPRRLIERAYFPDGEDSLSNACVQLTGLQSVCTECRTPFDIHSRLSALTQRYPTRSWNRNTLLPHLRCSTCHAKGTLTSSPGNHYGGILPAWGTLWAFDDPSDATWALQHLDYFEKFHLVAYDADELGFLFGVDGAGYDFVASHFMPLYQACRLQAAEA
jgi:hypothetical protein